jgi:branched-chain amino acid transport system substrate-binding protein
VNSKIKNFCKCSISIPLLALPLYAQSYDGSGSGVKQKDDTVKIGVLTDVTGPYAGYAGTGSVEAVRMAIEDFGGRVGQKRVELVVADHMNRADIATQTARKWFQQDGVNMITDLVGSGPAIAVSAVGRELHHVVMVTGAYSSRLTNEDCSPFTVHYQIDNVALASVPKVLVQQGKRSWYFITGETPFSEAMERDAEVGIRLYGGKIVGSSRHAPNASDFDANIRDGIESSANMLAITDVGADLPKSIKSANVMGATSGTQGVVAMALLLTDVHRIGLSVAQNIYTVESFYWDADDRTRQFAIRFYKRTGVMPTAIHAADYSATLTYLKAVEATGTDEAVAVMKYMKATTIDDVYARNARIRGDGRLMQDLYLMQVKSPMESRTPWDYYNVRARIPSGIAFRPMSESSCKPFD